MSINDEEKWAQPTQWSYDQTQARHSRNLGETPASSPSADRTAADIKELHEQFPRLADDELRRIPILPSGAKLQAGHNYLNLAERPSREFTAQGQEGVRSTDWIVPKDRCDYQLWNSMRGVQEREPTDGRSP